MDVAIEKNLIDLCKQAAAQSKGRIVEKENYSCTIGCPVDWYNKAFGFHPAHEDPRVLLAQLREDIRLGDAPPSLLLSGSSQSLLPGLLLREYGFSIFLEQTGMAIDLNAWEPDHHATGRDCRPIAGERELQEWIAVTEEAFGEKGDATLYRSLMNESDIELFGYYTAGRVVSTALLFMQDGVAGIHLVGTLHDCRGKGHGTAVTATALSFAKQAGYGRAALQASAMGKGVYSRIGFSEFSKLFHWRVNETNGVQPLPALPQSTAGGKDRTDQR
jgi:GNAT superfamily N-acetyltransferase